MNTIHEKDQLWQRVTKSKFFFIKEAVKRGIQCEILKDTCAYKLQYKKKVRYFYDLTPSTTTAFAIYCCKNKNITNKRHILRDLLIMIKMSLFDSFIL
mgnify:CR=1 FL=1